MCVQYDLPIPVIADFSITKSPEAEYCPKDSVKNLCSTLQVHLGIKSAIIKQYRCFCGVFFIYLLQGVKKKKPNIWKNSQAKALH